MTEKAFFRRVGEKLSAPNVFVLFNRWDCVDDADEDDEDVPIDRVREQHLGCCRELLVDQLGLTDADSIDKRVFFVSSKDVLKARVAQNNDGGIQASRSSSRSSISSPLQGDYAAERLRCANGATRRPFANVPCRFRRCCHCHRAGAGANGRCSSYPVETPGPRPL